MEGLFPENDDVLYALSLLYHSSSRQVRIPRPQPPDRYCYAQAHTLNPYPLSPEGLIQNGELNKLAQVLKQLTKKYKLSYMIGRTHGVHAEILTFGFKTAIWYQEALRNVQRFKQAVAQIQYGKISGAVGTYTNLDMRVEKYALRLLKLKPEIISSQIIQRDRFAYYIQNLALSASFIEKMAVEIRLLQKTETLEFNL